MIRPRAATLAAAVGLLAVLLAGCTEAPNLGSSSTYSTDDTITEIAEADRGEPIEFSGPLDTGGTADSSDWLGSVVVVNFWYAACPPCRAEAPDLEALYEQFAPDGVVFIGINVRDTTATATTFSQEFGITYPSILDAEEASVQLAFAGNVAPNAVPTTIILDQQGRPAARILGLIPSRTTLATLIRSVQAEDGP